MNEANKKKIDFMVATIGLAFWCVGYPILIISEGGDLWPFFAGVSWTILVAATIHLFILSWRRIEPPPPADETPVHPFPL